MYAKQSRGRGAVPDDHGKGFLPNRLRVLRLRVLAGDLDKGHVAAGCAGPAGTAWQSANAYSGHGDLWYPPRLEGPPGR